MDDNPAAPRSSIVRFSSSWSSLSNQCQRPSRWGRTARSAYRAPRGRAVVVLGRAASDPQDEDDCPEADSRISRGEGCLSGSDRAMWSWKRRSLGKRLGQVNVVDGKAWVWQRCELVIGEADDVPFRDGFWTI
jgi:hypothetical protein